MKEFAEFFAGIGLVREGLSQAGWHCVFANDIDPKKQDLYVKNYGADHFHLGDIYALVPAAVPSSLLATASFPCIDLSLAGSRRGLSGEHSGTFWGFVRILEGMGDRRPLIVMLENVPGFLSSHHGADFLAVIQALNKIGYRCDAFQVDAAHFVPQSRPRVFVVGARNDIMPPFGGRAYSRSVKLRPRILQRLIMENLALDWGEMALPDLPHPQTNFADVLENVSPDSDLWWADAAVNKLLDSMSHSHRLKAEAMARGDQYSFGTVYRRVRQGITRAELRTDGIAGALRTPRGGSSRQFLFVAGKGNYMARVLNGREYARLQGVRDSYRLDGVSDNQARFGFGDAVCVHVIRWIAENCLNVLAEVAVNSLVRA